VEPDYKQIMNDPTSRYLKGKLCINNMGIWIELARLWTKPTIRHTPPVRQCGISWSV